MEPIPSRTRMNTLKFCEFLHMLVFRGNGKGVQYLTSSPFYKLQDKKVFKNYSKLGKGNVVPIICPCHLLA